MFEECSGMEVLCGPSSTKVVCAAEMVGGEDNRHILQVCGSKVKVLFIPLMTHAGFQWQQANLAVLRSLWAPILVITLFELICPSSVLILKVRIICMSCFPYVSCFCLIRHGNNDI